MKVADGMEMLELPMLVNGMDSLVCPVLLQDGNDVLLIDTGYPGQLKQLKDATEKAGIQFQKISKILITHHDLDHIGCLAPIVKERNGNVEVLSHAEERPYIQGDETPLKLAQMESRRDTLSEQMRSLYEGMKRGFALSTAKVNVEVKDGDILYFCGGIEVIHTPGHTTGHISLYLKQSRTLVSGDALFVENGRLVAAPAFANHDTIMAKKSLKRLTEYDVDQVVCYHGGLYRQEPSRAIRELAID